MLLVDTNVLVDVLEDDPEWADWSVGQLRAQAQIHDLVINPVIYAELSLIFNTVEELDRTVMRSTWKYLNFLVPPCFSLARHLQNTVIQAAGNIMCWPISSSEHTPPCWTAASSHAMPGATGLTFRLCP